MFCQTNVGQARAKSGIADSGHELGDDGRLSAPQIGGNHASAPIEDRLRAVGLRSVLGLEVDVGDQGQQREDAKRRSVTAFFSFRGGSLVKAAECPAVYVAAVAYGRFEVSGGELRRGHDQRRFLGSGILGTLLLPCHSSYSGRLHLSRWMGCAQWTAG